MRTRSMYLWATAALCCACGNEIAYDACGSFEAEEVLVSAQGSGQLLWFDAAEGSHVTEEGKLCVIDTMQLHWQKVQLEAQMASVAGARPDIESQVATLRSQIANLKGEQERIAKLVAKGAAPTKQQDDIKAQIEVLQGQLKAQQTALQKNVSAADYNASAIAAQIAMTNDRIAKCIVTSPIHGTVIAKYANAGELVTMGKPLVRVANLDDMYLRAYFTSDQLARVNLGDEVTVTADFGGEERYDYKGRVAWISAESEFTPKNIQTRDSRANLVYAVKIAVKNDGRLKIGLAGEVKL